MKGRLVLASALVCAAATQLVAQQAGTTVAGTAGYPCTYDLCALRQEGSRVIRGVQGEQVVRLRLFGATRLTPLISGVSDSAVAHARVFDRNYTRGTAMLWSGIALVPLAMYFPLKRMDEGRAFAAVDVALVAMAVSGVVLEFWGAKKIDQARRALGRAIWWNNRDLPR